ncbi:MAG: hypothetical protein DRN71_02375 [Candidatus Nanohalarchaeota archaeon]|nr:MAG: hypothetical protein DRN71_02375 [Candidatus Nanohaloarchaeota archaeon]
MDIIKRLKKFLELTQTKIVVFFILFVISFSLFGPVFSGFLSFVLFVTYTYVYSCVLDKKIENIIRNGQKVSEQRIVGYGMAYLISIFLIVLVVKYFLAGV